MKRRFKRFLCGAVVLFSLAAGVVFLKDQAAGARAARARNPAPEMASVEKHQAPGARALPEQPAHAQTASEDVLLVNAQYPLPDGFAVDDLVELYGEQRSFQLATSDIRLDREAFEAANRMFEQANRDGVSGFILTSGYRTEQKQRELYANDVDGTAAKPGASEHQTGLAFDVTAYRDGGGFEVTEQFRWLSEHCWDFGFILRYPEGREDTTGIAYEPWHYRYVGVDIAREIRDNNWTLEDYFERSAA